MRDSRKLGAAIVLVALLVFTMTGLLQAQRKMDSLDEAHARGILRDAYTSVKKHYYDLTYHGIDLDARYHEYDEKIKNVSSIGQAFGVIAAFLDGFDDSHLFFRPPDRPFRVDYGYRTQMIGDDCFITRIRPGTDAETRVHLGDQVLTYNNIAVNRGNALKISYLFDALAPQSVSILALRTPTGQDVHLEVKANVRQLTKVVDFTGAAAPSEILQLNLQEQHADHAVRQQWTELGDAMVWKMSEFDLNDGEVDRIFGIAQKHKALVLDLRGNPGGAVPTLERMIANVIGHDVKVSDRVGREPLEPQLAKTRAGNVFSGALIVLVDSNSASAAELFARVIQIEHRGIVLGDRTSGQVMEAMGYSFSQGLDTKIFYAFSITDADLIMADGKSLERNGVVPDQIVLPTAQDLAAGRDPALSRAAELAGTKLDPVAAGKMFPFEWLPL